MKETSGGKVHKVHLLLQIHVLHSSFKTYPEIKFYFNAMQLVSLIFGQ
jgi:hypothetical protein